MYTINHLLQNYREAELAEGGELALESPVEISRQKTKSAREETLTLKAQFDTPSDQRTVSASVSLDPEHGELISSSCECDAFRRDGYACPHTVALQTAWLEEQCGREALAASPLLQILRKRTGLENPFLPGILRRTAKELSGLLEKQADGEEPALPVLSGGPAKTAGKAGKTVSDGFLAPGSIRLELHLSEAGEGFFELRVGQKRSFVVKDVSEFMRAFERHRELTFGKSLQFFAYREYFDAASLRLFSFLEELCAECKENSGKHILFSKSGNASRYIGLSGRDLDGIMETVGPDGIYDIGGKRAFFCPREQKFELKLEKQMYGAAILVPYFKVVGRTASWIYLLQGEQIVRIPREGGRMDGLIQAAQGKKNLYISEKDLPAVCTNVIGGLSEALNVTCQGMELETYLPEKPHFSFYMDYPQPDLISCQVRVNYRETSFLMGKTVAPEVSGDSAGKSTHRDLAAEQKMLTSLFGIFQAFADDTGSFVYQGNESEIFYFLTELMPQIGSLGEVFISDSLKKLQVRPVTSATVGVAVQSGLLQLDLTSEGFSKEELVEILSAYQRKKKFYRLKSGAFVTVDEDQDEMWSALSDCIRGLRRPKDGEWKIPIFRALYLDEMLKDREKVQYDKSREYRRLLGQMREAQNSIYEVPASLGGIMREYQADGFRWLKTLKAHGFGGILADDMGLGKTLQVLAFLLSEKEAGKTGDAMRTLIVTPASLLYNWKHEIEKFTPELNVRIIAGSAQERKVLILEGGGRPEAAVSAAAETVEGVTAAPDEKTEGGPAEEIWITSYDLLKRDIQWYEGIPFANEILDEAQHIKNQTTNAAKTVRLIQSGFRLALTGTPIENRLSDLWSIFDYLMPGFLFTYSRFREELELPAVNDGDKEAMEKLRLMVQPFVLRRLKKDVLRELPDKLEEEVAVSLEGEQRKLYDAHAQRLKMYLEKQSEEEFAHGKMEILAELTKLRQLCCGPELLMEKYQGPNAKLDTCMELVNQAIEGGHKVLLFSQFTSMLDGIERRLDADGIAHYRIDGSVSKENRMKRVDAFNTDDTPVFCISLKAGGTGLNLTAADIVIHYDPWWNLAAQNQATDRAHRIGQEHVVSVYQLIATGTVEEKIVHLQRSKYQLAQDVLSGEGISSIVIDREQVLSLLG